jgi:hypothetical protein
MRTALAIVVLFAAACGSSSTPNKTDGNTTKMDGNGSNHADAPLQDFGCGGGTPCTTEQVCCAMPGATTTFGCTAKAACPMANQITCDAPDDCTGGAGQVCCGVYVADGTGSFPQCGITSLGTSCTAKAACPTHIAQSCNDTSKVQLCQAASDCTDATNNKCCTFQSGAAALTFCIDATTAALGGGTCH